MDLYYYLDLLSLCNANDKQVDLFFRFAFNVINMSENDKGEEITEYFIKDDNALINATHKNGKVLYELIFNRNGEIANRIIPEVLKAYHNDGSLDTRLYGKISDDAPDIHPNAKLIIHKPLRSIWELYTEGHYNEFREFYIIQKIYSKDCEIFLRKYLPNITLTKKAIGKFENLAHSDKKIILSDLKKLNDYVNTEWTKGDFPIAAFSIATGVAASDETEKTKNDPECNRQRLFSIPGIGSVYCYLHIKISNTYRIHFHPEKADKRIYIPYIGKHLKTAKYK